MARWFSIYACSMACAMAANAAVMTQTSVEEGVTVAVTAGNLGAGTPVWDFAVVLSSPRHNLPDDLAASAVLVDPQGREHRALVWEGAPPQGDHRGGVLKFFAIEPRPHAVELRIWRPGEVRPRTFRWVLGSGLVAER